MNKMEKKTEIIITEQVSGSLITRSVSENGTIYYQQVRDFSLEGTRTFLDEFLERFNACHAPDRNGGDGGSLLYSNPAAGIEKELAAALSRVIRDAEKLCRL